MFQSLPSRFPQSASVRILLVAFVLLTLGFSGSAFAGTQDFSLVNQTGVEIWSLYISETTNDDWEEDVLGQNTLPNGARLDVTFSGRSACLWDMLATDSADDSITFQGINLCEVSVVVLRCDGQECWAEYE